MVQSESTVLASQNCAIMTSREQKPVQDERTQHGDSQTALVRQCDAKRMRYELL
jgi:hypothetical protein